MVTGIPATMGSREGTTSALTTRRHPAAAKPIAVAEPSDSTLTAWFQPDAGIVEAVPFFIEDALAMQQALVA